MDEFFDRSYLSNAIETQVNLLPSNPASQSLHLTAVPCSNRGDSLW